MKTNFWKFFLILVLFAKASFMIYFILHGSIGLGPDEAQYWTWSQALDWGYYSKPPGIAWLIWLGTQLFGQTELGVRFLIIALSLVQTLLIYQLALSSGLYPRTAFWCSLFFTLSPLGFAGSFFAITDVGFLLCWTGACLVLVSALNKNQEPNSISMGLWVAAGALFKWPIYLFWLFALCSRYWFYPNQAKRNFVSGILLSLLGLLPSIWWNWSHDWATFRHVFATVQGGSGHKAGGNIGEFLGSQAILLSPVLFILLVFSLWQWFKKKNQLSPSLFFCGFVTLISLGIAAFFSLFQKIQGNWINFAYPTGLVILGWYAFQEFPKRAFLAKMGLAISLLLISSILFLPTLYTSPSLNSYAPPYRMNSFKHNMGWDELSHVLAKNGYNAERHFLVSDKYQTASLLSFYSPEQKRAYFLNIHGIRNNQFSYWPSLQEEQKDQEGYFVWVENAPHLSRTWEKNRKFYQNELQRYFESVDFIELAPLIYQGNEIVKGAMIFRCQNCRFVEHLQSSLY